MKRKEFDLMNTIYTRWFHEEKTPATQTGWSDDNDQMSRFEQFLLLQEWCDSSFVGKNLLDVGCGFGDLCDFLVRKLDGESFSYTGIDSNKEFIKRVTKGVHKTFIHGNVLAYPFKEQFDFSFASGIFNVNVFKDQERAYEVLFDTVDTMLELSLIGVAFNFLSNSITEKFILTHEMIIYDTKKVARYYKKKGLQVKIIQGGYDEFDSTVLIKK